MSEPAVRRAAASRDAAALLIGTFVAGAGSYGFVVVATRALGAAGFAPVSVVWTLWTFAAASLSFPVQQWLVVSTIRRGDEQAMANAVRLVVAIAVGASLAAAIAAALMADRVRAPNALGLASAAAGTVLGSVLIGWVRGVLSARGRFVAAAYLGTESLLRFVLAGVGLVLGLSTSFYLGAVVLGAAVVLAVPSGLRPRVRRSGPLERSERHAAFGFAGGTAANQVLLNGPTLVVAAKGGAPELTSSVFLALSLLESPYLLLVGLAPRLGTTLARARAEDDGHRLRRSLLLVLLAAPVVLVVAAAVAAAAGQVVLRALFGADVTVPREVLALCAIGAVASIIGLLMLLFALAVELARTASVIYGAAVAGFVVVAVGVPDPALAASLAFAVSSVLAFATLGGVVARALRHPAAGA